MRQARRQQQKDENEKYFPQLTFFLLDFSLLLKVFSPRLIYKFNIHHFSNQVAARSIQTSNESEKERICVE
jgi:hypothetical protein